MIPRRARACARRGPPHRATRPSLLRFVSERCHPRRGREAAVGDPGKTLFETGSPTGASTRYSR